MKLKPCPFCGSTDIKVRKIEYPQGVWYWVECNVCYAEIGEQQPNEKAIAVWNTRSNEEIAKLLEVIKNLISVDFIIPSEMDGDPSCFWCGAWLSGEPHDEDCLYLAAKKILDEYGERG